MVQENPEPLVVYRGEMALTGIYCSVFGYSFLKQNAKYIYIRHLTVMKMKDVGAHIKDFFTTHPYEEHATSELIKAVYPEEYKRFKAALHDPYVSKETKIVARRHKSQLHRRLLYHLNRLEEENYIIVTRIKGKGEKCYALKRSGGQTSVKDLPQLLNAQPFHWLEHYHEQGILSAYDPRGWHSRMNAILVDVNADDTTTSVLDKIQKITPFVNDAIGVFGMEQLILKEDLDKVSIFLRKIDVDTRDNNKTISLIVDLTEAQDIKLAEDFFDAFALLKPARINIIITITKKFVEQHQRFMKRIIRSLSHETVKINLHNKEVNKAPIIIGRAGAYAIQSDEWDVYLKTIRGKTIGLCVAQISIGIDVQRFFTRHKNDTDFRNFVLKTARALVEANTLQRRRADVLFEKINKLNISPHDFYRFSTNTIRLWNYDWQEQEHNHFVELLNTCAEELENFCTVEETIFKSCGAPIRFKVSLASMFAKFQPGFFSKRNYKKMSISGLKALQGEEMRKFITIREKISKHMQYNDRVRIFRAHPLDADEIIKEMLYLLEEYRLPHFTYDFSERKANLTLDQFMGDNSWR